MNTITTLLLSTMREVGRFKTTTAPWHHLNTSKGHFSVAADANVESVTKPAHQQKGLELLRTSCSVSFKTFPNFSKKSSRHTFVSVEVVGHMQHALNDSQVESSVSSAGPPFAAAEFQKG